MTLIRALIFADEERGRISVDISVISVLFFQTP